jgi:hypothetical protein
MRWSRLTRPPKPRPALTHLPGESQTIGGFGRCDRFAYPQQFGGTGEIANRVLLEAGTARMTNAPYS